MMTLPFRDRNESSKSEEKQKSTLSQPREKKKMHKKHKKKTWYINMYLVECQIQTMIFWARHCSKCVKMGQKKVSKCAKMGQKCVKMCQNVTKCGTKAQNVATVVSHVAFAVKMPIVAILPPSHRHSHFLNFHSKWGKTSKTKLAAKSQKKKDSKPHRKRLKISKNAEKRDLKSQNWAEKSHQMGLKNLKKGLKNLKKRLKISKKCSKKF
jgi:hypothetical protein